MLYLKKFNIKSVISELKNRLMKKILLIAAAVLSLNTFARTTKTKVSISDKIKTEEVSKFKTAARTDLMKAGNANKAKAKAPASGTTKTYYADYEESVTGLTSMMERVHVKYDITFGDDGKVYIPNLFLRSVAGDDVYLTGTYDSATNEITLDNNQEIYDLIMYSLFVSQKNYDTGNPDTEGYKLILDPQTGIIRSADMTKFLTAFLTDGNTNETYTDIRAINYYPADMFPAPETHKYEYTDKNNNRKETTIDIVNMGTLCYARNLLPTCPDAWIEGYYDGDDIVFNSYDIGDDDLLMMFGSYVEMSPSCRFTYDSYDNTYKGEEGISLMDYYYYYGGDLPSTFYSDNSCSEMVIHADAVSGISSLENAKEPVSTEYFDLSGRRINNADKGISIMRMKYADGTTKAVKVMK